MDLLSAIVQSHDNPSEGGIRTVIEHSQARGERGYDLLEHDPVPIDEPTSGPAPGKPTHLPQLEPAETLAGWQAGGWLRLQLHLVDGHPPP